MSDEPQQPYDPAANTEMFQAFVHRTDEETERRPNRQAVAFRLWTLLLGLAVFVALGWLILKA